MKVRLCQARWITGAWCRAATDLGLKLLALIVQVAHDAEIGLVLVLEEGVVQDLVVDVQLAHLGLHLVFLL